MRGLVIVALASVACSAGGGPEVEVAHVQRPDPETCALGTTASDSAAGGTLDLARGDRPTYTLTPTVRSRLADELTLTTVRLRVFWERPTGEQRVQILCAGGELCSEWTEPLCASERGLDCPRVPARGEATFEVPALPRLVVAWIQSQLDGAVAEGRVPPIFDLRAQVVLEGFAGGEAVQTEPYSHAIAVCLGCLVEYPDGSDDPTLPGPDCCGASPVGDQGCYPGQDDPIHCAECRRTAPDICNFGRLSCGG